MLSTSTARADRSRRTSSCLVQLPDYPATPSPASATASIVTPEPTPTTVTTTLTSQTAETAENILKAHTTSNVDSIQTSPHCDRTFTSHADLLSHLQIQIAETGTPGAF
nr:unnamed protein product [Spirometra erinaceieuropaei]